MAAAAVVSLKQKIVGLLNPSQSQIDLPRSELESICEDLSYWQSFLQTMSNDRVNALQAQIVDLSHNFEYTIESYTSDWNRSKFEGFEGLNLDFGFFREIVQFKSKTNSLTKMMESEREKHLKTGDQRPSSSFVAESDTTKMVGLVDALQELKERVLGGDYLIISIVGMAGIGKTTLAKEFYYNPICLDRFELRLFLTVGPQYQPRQFLLLALAQLGFPINEMRGKKFAELKEHLLHLLYGKMYLIVLDDIWDTQVWHEIQILFFPYVGNGCRIIMTTRLLNLAGHPSCDMPVPLLNDEESWDLLCKMVFIRVQESSLWDHQLEKIGRKIAKNCEGLPLAIIEVGKILCKTDRTVESWMEIAELEDPLVIKIDDGTPISNTLSSSYIKLPPHLKSCFMYMGVFRKNYEIPTIKLINLWISEGFITHPWSTESLEEVAEGCLDDLVSRSLVLVCKGISSGGIKTCRIHFVYRNICISEAKNENLFDIIKKYPNSFPKGQRGLCFHNNSVLGFKQVHNSLLESGSDPRTLLFLGPQHQHPLRLYLHFPSLRVLDAVTIRFYKFPHQVVELVELRYLTITYDGEIPPSISKLCRLEVLIVRRHHESLRPSSDAPVYLPMEIWELRKLRHLQCIGYDLPDPTKDDGSDIGSYVILENLSTLSGVSAHSCKRGVLHRMPNLTKLGIRIHEYFSLYDEIKYAYRLESFKCVVLNPGLSSRVVSYISKVPYNIRKITLSGCGFSWPTRRDLWNNQKLEVLKLKSYAFCGPDWNISEWSRFKGLKFLLLEDLDIEHWMIDSSCFPNLRHLIIRHCYKLQDIPSCLGKRLSLEMLEVDDCCPSLVISAQQIRELQHQQKNAFKTFQLRIHSSWDDKKSHNFEKIERTREREGECESMVVMVDAALERLLEKLQQLLIHHEYLILYQVKKMEKDLPLFKAFLMDFSKTRRNDNSLRELVAQIRDVVYEVEEVIDAFVTQATDTRYRDYFVRALKFSETLRTIAKEVVAVGFKVRDIYGDKSRLDFATLTVGDGGGGGPHEIDERQRTLRVLSDREISKT